ncbi:dihydrolipoamide acetyltransferase [Desulfosarcina cetonica]
MATDIVMPKWGLTMKAGKVSRWFKTQGDVVQKDEALFEVETDKITNKVESPVDGILFQIVVPAGETVPVQTVVAVISDVGETPERRSASSSPAEEPPAKAAAAGPAAPAGKAAFVPATPIARRLAKERGIDLALVKGSGPKGRVTEQDVLDYQPPAPAAEVNASPQAITLAAEAGIDLKQISGSGEGGRITKIDVLRAMQPTAAQAESAPAGDSGVPLSGVVPMTGMRKIIADNMMASLHQSAQLTVFVTCEATAMTAFRDRVRLKFAGAANVPKVSYNDIIALAVSRTLKDFPILNSWLTDEGIVIHAHVQLGIAVALDDGLVVPHVKDADTKGLLQLAGEIRVLAEKAKTGGLTLDEIQGGTFTITNVSMLGVDGFTPILNPPETAILGVGRAVDQPVVRDGVVGVGKMMTLSLTFDHRVTDGAPAMRFLRALADRLEDPAMIVV